MPHSEHKGDRCPLGREYTLQVAYHEAADEGRCTDTWEGGLRELAIPKCNDGLGKSVARRAMLRNWYFTLQSFRSQEQSAIYKD